MSVVRLVFMGAWLLAWLVVGFGALRAVTTLWRLSDEHEAGKIDRDEVDRAASRARRWAYAMIGLGCVMALLGPALN